jgi:hypothetical protein
MPKRSFIIFAQVSMPVDYPKFEGLKLTAERENNREKCCSQNGDANLTFINQSLFQQRFSCCRSYYSQTLD